MTGASSSRTELIKNYREWLQITQHQNASWLAVVWQRCARF